MKRGGRKVALREERHRRRAPDQGPVRRSRARSALRRFFGWLPDLVVVALVVTAFVVQQYDLSLGFLGHGSSPASVQPRGLALPAQPVAAPVAPTYVRSAGAGVSTVAVRSALAPFIGDPDLGGRTVVMVADLDTGTVVYRHGLPGPGSGTVTPASTMKLLTTTAALAALGPMARFRTSVRLDAPAAGTTAASSTARITLVGGGDPFLMSSSKALKGAYPERADLGTLAARTAQGLTARGVRRVRLSYDASLFVGPAASPDWPATYLSGGVVPPIGALWADEGAGPGGRYVADPAAAAAATFAQALRRLGIAVRGPVVPGPATPSAVQVASVDSAPLGEIVEQTLAASDNNAAEVLAHQVGLAVVGDPSFRGGARAVRQVLTGLGVPLAGARILDGSGLSRRDLLSPEALLGVLRLAASAQHPTLRPVITGLPVAGFTGSLQGRFANVPAVARGRVRAKTGTLTGVDGLAGIATDLDGDRLVFVVIADRVAGTKTLAARSAIDRIAAALGACRCGSAVR